MKLVLKHGDSDYLMHYRVGGEKKGVRRWQNKDGSYTSEGYQHYADMYGWGEKKDKQPSKATISEKEYQDIIRQNKSDDEEYEKEKAEALSGSPTLSTRSYYKALDAGRSSSRATLERNAGHEKESDFYAQKAEQELKESKQLEEEANAQMSYESAQKEVQKIGQKAKSKVHSMIAKAMAIGGGGTALQAAYSMMKYNEASGIRQMLVGLSSGVSGNASGISNAIKQAQAVVNYSGDFLRNGMDMISKIANGSDAVRVLAGSQANAVAVLGTAGVAALGAGVIGSAAVASYCGIRYAVKKHKLKKQIVEHADESEIDGSDIDALDDSVKLAILMILDEIMKQSK